MRATERRRHGRVAACALLLASLTAQADEPAEPPGLVVSADGSEVLNLNAGIAWARCVQGMQWSGRSCTGTPQLLDHRHAIAAAAARRAADGKAWRLPRAPELQRLASQRAHAPAQRPGLFPAAPPGWQWSASTTLDTSRVNAFEYGNIQRGLTNDNLARVSVLHGWAVDPDSGQIDNEVTKRTPLAVRLVRSLER